MKCAGFCYDEAGKKKNLGDSFLFFRCMMAPKSCAFNDPESTVTLRHPTPKKTARIWKRGQPQGRKNARIFFKRGGRLYVIFISRPLNATQCIKQSNICLHDNSCLICKHARNPQKICAYFYSPAKRWRKGRRGAPGYSFSGSNGTLYGYSYSCMSKQG